MLTYCQYKSLAIIRKNMFDSVLVIMIKNTSVYLDSINLISQFCTKQFFEQFWAIFSAIFSAFFQEFSAILQSLLKIFSSIKIHYKKELNTSLAMLIRGILYWIPYIYISSVRLYFIIEYFFMKLRRKEIKFAKLKLLQFFLYRIRKIVRVKKK